MEIVAKCTCCSKGCNLKINEESLVVVGNSCPRGAEYGVNEVAYRRKGAETSEDSARECPENGGGV